MNRALRNNIRILLLHTLLCTALFTLISCGGGVAGSGNGGGPTSADIEIIKPDITTEDPPAGSDGDSPEEPGNDENDHPGKPEPLPIGSESRYQFNYLPEETISDLPGSLVSNKVQAADNQPYYQMSIQLAKIEKTLFDLHLAQLQMDANWLSVLAYCKTTPVDSPCDLSDAQLSTPYTREMAFWEYDLRTEYEALVQGADKLTAERKSQILTQTTARIGTELLVDSGIITVRYDDQYRYELQHTIDHIDSANVYSLQWSPDYSLVKMTVTASSSGETKVMSSIHNRSQQTGGFGTILFSKGSGENMQEFNFNYQEADNSSAIILESQLSTTNLRERIEILSYGKAKSTGGYLSSTISIGQSDDNREVYGKREAFGQNKQVQKSDVCYTSYEFCVLGFLQFLSNLTGLFDSSYFLATEEIEKNIGGVWVNISSVDTQPDAFVLLDPNKIDMQRLTENQGTNIFEAILGNINQLTRREQAFGVSHAGLLLSTRIGYDGAVLCRLNRLTGKKKEQYRSFCASNPDKIRNAVVITETYTNNRLVTKYQTNADITVTVKNY